MIVFEIFALLVIAYRMWRRRASSEEVRLLLLLVGIIAMIVAQSVICSHCLPEKRYWRQVSVLVYPWGVWGFIELAKYLRRSSLRWGLFLIAGVVVYDIGNLLHPVIPGFRREAYVKACDWAVEEIRRDWKGPVRDEQIKPLLSMYYLPYRPSVCSYVSRVPYLLNGRRWSEKLLHGTGQWYDYWVGDVARDELPPEDKYERIGTFTRGKYTFALYRRK